MQYFQEHHSVFLYVEYPLAIGGLLFYLVIIINPSSDSRFKMSFSKGRNKLYCNISSTLLTAFPILVPWDILNYVTFTVLYIPVMKHVFSSVKHRQVIITLFYSKQNIFSNCFPKVSFNLDLFCLVLFCRVGGQREEEMESDYLMGPGFLSGEIKMFWHQIVEVIGHHCEYIKNPKLYTLVKVVNFEEFCLFYLYKKKKKLKS